MDIKTHAPITVLYRGNLRDTAILVGLVQSRVPIGLIAYSGELGSGKMEYLRLVNSWLEIRDQPQIAIHPSLSFEQLNLVVCNPLPEWGWSENECKAAIQLVGLPPPP